MSLFMTFIVGYSDILVKALLVAYVRHNTIELRRGGRPSF